MRRKVLNPNCLEDNESREEGKKEIVHFLCLANRSLQSLQWERRFLVDLTCKISVIMLKGDLEDKDTMYHHQLD